MNEQYPDLYLVLFNYTYIRFYISRFVCIILVHYFNEGFLMKLIHLYFGLPLPK
jgi:hypothetical protein